MTLTIIDDRTDDLLIVELSPDGNFSHAARYPGNAATPVAVYDDWSEVPWRLQQLIEAKQAR